MVAQDSKAEVGRSPRDGGQSGLHPRPIGANKETLSQKKTNKTNVTNLTSLSTGNNHNSY